MPPLRALQAFEAVSRRATFAEGAEELGVTPSAVSHQIQQLEEFLGVALFRREAGRATLTSAGQIYAQEIRGAFALIQHATSVVAPRALGGHLIIACSPSFASKWLQPRLPAFLAANPKVRVRLSTVSSDEPLDKDRCDVAIVYGRPPAAHGHSEPLLVERLRPLCSPGLKASLGLQTPEDLARATLIHSVNALSWTEYLRRIGFGHIPPHNELWINPSSIAIDAAVAGVGVILESELLAEQELRDGRLMAPFAWEGLGVEAASYFLVQPPGAGNRSQVSTFERWLRSSIASASAALPKDKGAGLQSTV